MRRGRAAEERDGGNGHLRLAKKDGRWTRFERVAWGSWKIERTRRHSATMKYKLDLQLREEGKAKTNRRRGVSTGRKVQKDEPKTGIFPGIHGLINDELVRNFQRYRKIKVD